MKENKKYAHLLIQVIILIAVFANIYFTAPDAYLFQWIIHNRNLYLIPCAVFILISLLISFKLGYALVGGHVLGLFLGHFLGGYLLERNLSKITTSMSPEEVYQLSYRHDVFIWIGCIIVAGVIYALYAQIAKRKDININK